MKKWSVFLLGALLLLTACSPKEKKEISYDSAQSQQAVDEAKSSQVESEPALGEFSTQDLEGNEITSEIFSDYDLTMVNIWTTYCGVCLSELPELGKLNEDYQDKNFQVVGIVMDVFNKDGTYSEEQIEVAKYAAEETGATYAHLLPSQEMIDAKLSQVTGVPETIFVDKQGNQVGKIYLGARSSDDWKKIIDSLLTEVE